MPIVEMAKNLKRIKTFITPDGKIQKGSASDYYDGTRDNLGGTGQPSTVYEKPKSEKKKN